MLRINAESGAASWFALRIRPNLERVTTDVLLFKGIEAFFPVRRVRRRWSDRIKELDVPLFPGYTFCKFDPNHRALVLSTPGALSIVGYGSNAAVIEDAEIVAIQRIAASRLPAHESPFVRIGHRILIDRGPLAGVEGIVLNLKNEYRLIVSITILQRSVSVEIESRWVRLIDS